MFSGARYVGRMFKQMLAAIDGSECSLHALKVAAAFARDQQAGLRVCTVVDPAKAAAMAFGEAAMSAACLDALDQEGRTLAEDAVAAVREIWPAEIAVLEGAPVDSIVQYAAETKADLIIVGSHGRSGFAHFFLGSVAEGVIRNAVVPVLVIRQAPTHHSAPAKPSEVEAKAEAATQ
jgi:nucleotide-binding universal stress UspA family protein